MKKIPPPRRSALERAAPPPPRRSDLRTSTALARAVQVVAKYQGYDACASTRGDPVAPRAAAPPRPRAGRSRRKLRQSLDLHIAYGGDLVYPTFAAAAQALCQFIAATRLPIPTIVDTDTPGTGTTAWWWFDEPLARSAWEKAARRLQRRCRRHGLWSDGVGDLSQTVRPPAAVHLLVEGDHIDPRTALAVQPRRCQ